jgi:uncharacterized protein DUF3131
MKHRILLLALSAGAAAGCQDSRANPAADTATVYVTPQALDSDLPAYAPAVLREPLPSGAAGSESEVLDRAARAAWKLIDGHYFPATGLVSASSYFPYPTGWDIASTLAAYYAARELGYINTANYRERASKLLQTLQQARLHHGIAYGRNYDARTGELVGPDLKPDSNGTGYSATDVGRLLVVLAIVAKHDSALAPAARAVVARLDSGRIVHDGYLRGQEMNPEYHKMDQFQEGRIGYEQYAAAGFALWGMKASKALDPSTNAKNATVLGIPITADKRGRDRLTSEPIMLQGLELGWEPAMREIAIQTLSAQAQRFATTGQMTIVSEDAINLAPYYFYYYCVYSSGKPFVVNAHGARNGLDGPRWVSTKAAFAWFALLPNKYTWDAIQAVQPALDRNKGWATGVFEGTNASTKSYSLNTAAVILESVLYRKTGKPLIS